jgi:HlyD family secretion protein
MKKTTLGLLVIGAAVAAGIAWHSTREKPVSVAVTSVVRGEVTVSVSNTRAGTVNTCNRARMSPILGGQIASLGVRPGDKVEEGQLLLELWNGDVRAQLHLARMEKETAIAYADQSCASAAVARREADRIKKLLAEKMVSDERADIVRGEAKAKTAACRAMRNSIEVSIASIAIAEARLEQTVLRAPFAGTVAEINGEIGEIVTPSPVGVATLPAVDLIDDSCTYVSAPIDEVDAPSIRAGMTASITLDAFSDRRFPATVRRVAPYVLDLEKQARTVEIEVEFDEPSSELLPGYSADVEVTLATRTDTLLVPTQTVKGGNTVLVINNEGIIKEQAVVTGLRNWEVTEITRGLKEGDTIVLSIDREGVSDGAVAVIETDAAE